MNVGNLRLALISTSSLATALFTFLAVPTTSVAEEALQLAPPTATTSDSTQVQEVVVTAQKRAEPLEKVPVAVQVVQGQALQNENFNDLTNLAQVVPDVHVVQTGSFANSLNIRGIGSGAGNPAFDQSVATFDDDIYYGRSRMIQSTFLDLERIEVLKGPQSTFFGNNAIAGALNIVTKKPGDHWDGYARALYGSYGTYALEGAVGGPVTDKLLVRIAATANGDTGWIRNVNTGKEAPGEQNYAGRLTAVYKPTSDFDATLKIEGGSNLITGATSNTPAQWTHCPPPAPLKVNGLNNFCSAALAQHVPMGFDNDQNSTLPGQFALLTTNDDVLTLNYHKWGQTFTSVTGYYMYHFQAQQDNAGAGGVVQSTNSFVPENYHQFSQEFRITSPAGQPIEYLAGVYYQTDNTSELLNGNASYLSPNFPTYAALGLITPATLTALTPLLPLGYEVGYTQKETVESIFGAFSLNATSRLKFNLGLRGTSDEKQFVGAISYGHETGLYNSYVPDPPALQSGLGFLLGPPGSYPYSRTDKAVLGNVGVQYQVYPQAMLYFTASRGFKAGGYNAISPSPLGGLTAPTFGPEYVNAYEVGLKSKWFGNRLLLNLDAFREDYKGLQVNSLVQLAVNATIAVANAAAARSQGAEFESQWVISRNFSLIADITYLDAHYVSYPKASPTFVEKQNKVTSQDLSGRPLDFASKWSGSLTAEYRVNLPNGYRLTADLSPFAQSKYFNSSGTDDAIFLIPGSIRWDGKVTLDLPGRRWAIDIIGKNLTNAVIPVSYGTNNTGGGKEEPVSVAVQARFKW